MSHSRRRKKLRMASGTAAIQTPGPTGQPLSSPPQVRQVSAQFFQGPLPPPEILERYDRAVPGLADRIIKLTEEQSAHRQYLERRVIGADIIAQVLGQVFGFVLGLAGIGLGAYLIWAGNPLTGTVFGGGSLVALVTVFVYGARKRSRERTEKYSQMRK